MRNPLSSYVVLAVITPASIPAANVSGLIMEPISYTPSTSGFEKTLGSFSLEKLFRLNVGMVAMA